MENKLLHNQTVGRQGERIACRYLRLRLYRILETNYKKLNGEIDIIAKKGKTVVFVEVKTRTSDEYGGGLAAVTKQKQDFIRRTAVYYMMKTKVKDVRFDVIEINGKMEAGKFKKQSLQHIKGAF